MPSNSEPSDAPSGVLLVDKPSGITSHDVVDAIRRCYRTRRVGHAGTLDPLASGLLIVMIGQGTKIARYLTGLDKGYRATIRFGWTSTTGDADGDIEPDGDGMLVTPEKLDAAIAAHTGTITQHIPDYAAIRTDGQRRYEIAREGKNVPEMCRQTTIHAFDLLSWEPPEANVRIHCSSGTYIRSLAESVGRSLDCGGYVAGLRRERIGEWSLDDAAPLDAFPRPDRNTPGLKPPQPLSVETFLPFPRLTLNDERAKRVAQGIMIYPGHINGVSAAFPSEAVVVLEDGEGRALAVGRATCSSDDLAKCADDRPVFRYERVLN